MAREIPFDDIMTVSRVLGTKYAEHLVRKGATMKGYDSEQQDLLLMLFNERVEKVWVERYGIPPTQVQKEALEEVFGRSFYRTLGSLT